MITRLLLATGNSGKIEEVRAALKDLELELVTAGALGSPAPQETGDSFAANARIKALHYWRLTGLPSLADDSGLEVEALQGRPGIHSARYAATDGAKIRRLLRELSQLDPPAVSGKRAARFVCALCLAHKGGLLEVDGEVRGLIAPRPRGTNGFGYDPVFFYPPLGKTFGQLDRSVKNTVSHRAAALGKLRHALKDLAQTGPFL